MARLRLHTITVMATIKPTIRTENVIIRAIHTVSLVPLLAGCVVVPPLAGCVVVPSLAGKLFALQVKVTCNGIRDNATTSDKLDAGH